MPECVIDFGKVVDIDQCNRPPGFLVRSVFVYRFNKADTVQQTGKRIRVGQGVQIAEEANVFQADGNIDAEYVQQLFLGQRQRFLQNEMDGGIPAFGSAQKAVSYTHLDVYKRQDGAKAYDGAADIEVIKHEALNAVSCHPSSRFNAFS